MSETTYKDNIDRFVPMDDEGQKDLLFIMLDAMDEVATAIEKVEDDVEKAMLKLHLALYENITSFFLEDPEWMKDAGVSSIGFLRRYAKARREEWERKRKESEA